MGLRRVQVKAWRTLANEDLKQNQRAQQSFKLANESVPSLASVPLPHTERFSYPETFRKNRDLFLACTTMSVLTSTIHTLSMVAKNQNF
mgnify:CR=1 FL=1